MKKTLKYLSYVGIIIAAGGLAACANNPFLKRIDKSTVQKTKDAVVQEKAVVESPTKLKAGLIPVKASTKFAERSPKDVQMKKGGRRGEDLTKSIPPSDAKSKLALDEKKRKAERKSQKKLAQKKSVEPKKVVSKKVPMPVEKPKIKVASVKAAVPVISSSQKKEFTSKTKELNEIQKEIETQKKALSQVQEKLSKEQDKLEDIALSKREEERKALAQKIKGETHEMTAFGAGVSARSRKGSSYKDTVEDWTAYEGATLKGLLQEWGDIAGWRVVWSMDRDYVLEAGAVFRGRFIDVTSALLRSFARATPAPLGTFYKGNKVLVISTREDENAD